MSFTNLTPEQQKQIALCLADLGKVMESYYLNGLSSPSQIAFVSQQFLSQVILTLATKVCAKDKAKDFIKDYLNNLQEGLFADYEQLTGLRLTESIIVAN